MVGGADCADRREGAAMLIGSRTDREHPARDDSDRPAWIGRLRLFGLLALLVPLFAGLQFLVREAVPRIEIRFVSQDVPVNVPVVVPVERVVERIVYVEVERPAPGLGQNVDSLGVAAGTESAQEPAAAVADESPADDVLAESQSAVAAPGVVTAAAAPLVSAPAPSVEESIDEPAQVAEEVTVEAAPVPIVVTERVARIAPAAVSSISTASTEPWRVEPAAEAVSSVGEAAEESPEAASDEATPAVATDEAPADEAAVVAESDGAQPEDEQASAEPDEDTLADAGDESPKALDEGVAAIDENEATRSATIGQAGIGMSVSDAISVLQDVAREKPELPVDDEALVEDAPEAVEAVVAEDAAGAQVAQSGIDEPQETSDEAPAVADVSGNQAQDEESDVAVVADEAPVADQSEIGQTGDVAALSAGAMASVEQVITEVIPGQ